MTKAKSKRLLSLLLSLALVVTMVAPALAADTTVDDTAAVTAAETATEETAAEAAEETTTIEEVTATADTVDAAETEAEETEEIETVTAEMETVDAATDAKYIYVLSDCSSNVEATNMVNGSVTVPVSYSLSDGTEEQGALVKSTDYATSGFKFFGGRVTGMTSSYTTAGDGIYFQIYDVYNNIQSSTMMNIALTVGETTYNWYSAAANSNVSTTAVVSAGSATTSTTTVTYNETELTGTLYTFYVPYSQLTTGSQTGATAEDVIGSNEFSISAGFRCNQMSQLSTVNDNIFFIYDNFGIYSATELEESSSGSDEPSSSATISNYSSEREAVQTANDVTVDQDFTDASISSKGAEATDVYYNSGSGKMESADIDTTDTYLDGSYALFNVTKGPYNLRMQTSMTELSGQGLYFEVASNTKNACFSNCTITLFDSSSAQDQETSNTVIGTNIVAGNVAQYVTPVFADDEENNYVYAVMIPWSAFSDDTVSYNVEDYEIQKNLSIRIWFPGDVSNIRLAVDNIGYFKTATATLGVSTSETDEVPATIAAGYGTDTMYALVTSENIGTYNTTDYPTTSLTFDEVTTTVTDNGDGTTTTTKSTTKHTYIFAGWYSDLDGNYCEDVPTSDAYAKFVDVDVLKVGFQYAADGDSYLLRLISTVDSVYYESTGFQVTFTGYDEKDLDKTTVYDYITGYSYTTTETDPDSGEEVEVETYYAPTQFCGASEYFNTVVISGVTTDLSVIVYAYWVTLDGTTVVSALTTTYSGTLTWTDGTGWSIAEIVAA